LKVGLEGAAEIVLGVDETTPKTMTDRSNAGKANGRMAAPRYTDSDCTV
jgi:hypothetical protein